MYDGFFFMMSILYSLQYTRILSVMCNLKKPKYLNKDTNLIITHQYHVDVCDLLYVICKYNKR